MTYTKSLSKLSNKDVAVAGGKGASLGELLQAKVLVPSGFVVLTDAFDRFLDDTDLRQEVLAQLNKVDQDKMHTIERASERIQQMILQADMPKEIAETISKDFSSLGAKYVAVRSSATAEDSDSATWAGQLETYLNTTQETLLENVKKCWASLFTPRAIFYRFEKGLKKSNVSVAVVVQEMIESEKAGVAFSVHPVTQDKNQMIIEAGLGLGEAVVSGAITPDSYVVSKKNNKIININIHEQTKVLYKKNGGGNEWKDLYDKGAEQVLNEKDILKLAETIKKIESHYKTPQDIEWAYANGEFYITQSRPITTIGRTNAYKKFFYELYYTSTGQNIIDIDMTFNSNTGDWGDIVFWNNKIVHCYLSPTEQNRVKAMGKLLFDDKFIDTLFLKSSELSTALQNYEGGTCMKHDYLKLWEKVIALNNKFYETYRFYCQPTMSVLDDEVLKQISKKDLTEILSHDSFDKLPNAKTKKYVERLLEMGKVKLRLHEDSEKFFTDDIFLKYVSKKHGLPMEIVGAMRVSEFEKALRGKLTVTIDELKERLKGSVFVKKKDKWNLYTGKQYEYWKNKIQGTYNGEVVGDVAFSGIAKGRVVIHLSWTDTTDVKDGDVLVTGMTNPQMIPLLKKASAIVTDEGGITCHAAIISRELRKPCIVGTKNATQVLGDGDLVEVNASEGFVRIIKKSKK